MTLKRRRERDKPKSAPDSLYNPNKRILLCYDSSDAENGDLAAAEALPSTVDFSSYQIQTYEESLADDEVADTKGQDEPESDLRAQDLEGLVARRQDAKSTITKKKKKKKKKKQSNSKSSEKPNEASNEIEQPPELSRGKVVLGSVRFQWYDRDNEDLSEEDDEYEADTREAMAYLHSVRDERRRMPDVLYKAVDSEQMDEDNEQDGYVSDGAYVGRSRTGPSVPTSGPSTDPREAFDMALKRRFCREREKLRSTTIATDDTLVQCLGRNKATWNKWAQKIRSTMPSLAEIQSMSDEMAWSLLHVIERRVLLRNRNVTNFTGAWVWSLLARLDDLMDHEMTWKLRELGKRAIVILTSFTSPVAAEILENQAYDSDHAEDTDDTDDEVHISIDEEGDGQTNHADPMHDERKQLVESSRTILDMVITLIGTVFGQKDLLEFRVPWEEQIQQ